MTKSPIDAMTPAGEPVICEKTNPSLVPMDIDDLVNCCLPWSPDNIYKCLRKLKHMMSRSDNYAGQERLILTKWFLRSKGYLDRSKGFEHYYSLYLRLKTVRSPKPPCAGRAAPISSIALVGHNSMVSITSFRSLAEIKTVLGNRVNISNLEEVFGLVYAKGIGRDRFHLSCNGHRLNAGVVGRNLERLGRLGLLEKVYEGRQWRKRNLLGATTNPASQYSLTFGAQSGGGITPAADELTPLDEEPYSYIQRYWWLALCYSPEELADALERAVMTC